MPARIEIHGSDGLLATVGDSSSLSPNDRNEVSFDEVETQFIAVNMYRKSSELWVGICELEVWTPAVAGPTYHAVDAYLTGQKTSVMFDHTSTATAKGAVVGGVMSDSNVAFSGIVSSGGETSLTLTYSNAGNSTVDLSVEVNQVPQTSLSLLPSQNKYVDTTATVTLATGKNYISLRGGSDYADVRLETLGVL